MIIEDDLQILDSLAALLSLHGYAVEPHRDAARALERLRQTPPIDLILLDLMMGGMNGWEFRALQKADEVLRRVPVLAMSADTTAKAAAIDATTFLPKPLHLPDLLAAIERLFREQEAREMKARLDQAERLASLGTLAAGVGHEISNPLAFMAANVENLSGLLAKLRQDVMTIVRDPSEGRAGPQALGRLHEAERLLDTCRVGAERIRNVVRSLQTLARTDEARRPNDVNAILDAAIEMTTNHIRHRARLIRKFGALRPVLGNEWRLGQLFVNLLLNAAQAIPEGEADANAITVTTRIEGDQIVAEVADTGEGIAPQAKARLFDPFFTTKPMGMGTGLGLSVCQSVVAEHGGRIEVESELGRGSLFRVFLPAALPQSDVAAPAAPATTSEGVGRGRVLIADDEAMIAAALKNHLEEKHDVTTVHDGAALLKTIASGPPFDVLVCDLMMPNVTGMQVYETIARDRPALAPRVVFMTGGAFSPQSQEFVARFSGPILAKPFPLRTLGEVVDRIIAEQGRV